MPAKMATTKYAPHSIPDRGNREPSFRDDVRRTIVKHSFTPSTTHYTDQNDMYQLFRADNGHAEDTPVLQEKFRSALGRVLRPPISANAFAQSFAAPILRWQSYLSLVSPDCPSMDLKEFIKTSRREEGCRRREAARVSVEINQIRDDRRIRKLTDPTCNCNTVTQEQHVSFRYVDELLTLNCAEDLFKLKIFPNGKELAESMSAYSTVREFLYTGDETKSRIPTKKPITFDNRNIQLIAVGDGVTPRTAALFAFRTQWQCTSIDPGLRKGAWDSVANLTTHAEKVQDVTIPIASSPDVFVIVVMWHAHVSIRDAVSCLDFDGVKWNLDDPVLSAKLRKRVAIVSCACCNYDIVQQEMPDGSPPDVEFEDEGVPGLMRNVRVWQFTT